MPCKPGFRAVRLAGPGRLQSTIYGAGMFEIEVSHGSIDRDNIPDDVTSHFAGSGLSADAVSVLPWEEHCTECAMPECYSSCDLYEPRKDGKCRRFTGGIVVVPRIDNIQGHIVRVSFKRWGQLMAYGNTHMVSMRRARSLERFMLHGARLVSRVPDSSVSMRGRKSVSARMMRRFKQYVAGRGLFADRRIAPDSFLAEIFNPGPATVRLTLTISSSDPDAYHAGYQKLLELEPGFNSFQIDVVEISRQVDLSQRFSMTFNPNILHAGEEGLTLYFGLLTFVSGAAYAKAADTVPQQVAQPYVKVAAWDLDNTLWQGTLIEDGLDGLALRPGIAEIVRQFDERGILNTIVSKNNRDDAMSALVHFGLAEYFLHPSIGWERKGVYLKNVPVQFNVGPDAVAFIDDSPFERDEAFSLNNQLRVYDAKEVDGLLDKPEFNPPRTAESGRRREFYLTQEVRDDQRQAYGDDYLTFLRDCRIVLDIYRPDEANIDRIQELVQRTNQLNFSGNRYQREQIASLLADPRYLAYCMDCEDRYGQYGTVGFAVIDKRDNKLVDMMLSCRVQSKRVEHAFVSYLLRCSRDQGQAVFLAQYNRTDRNIKAGAVFEDLGFRPSGKEDVPGEYMFDLGLEVPDDDVIEVRVKGEP